MAAETRSYSWLIAALLIVPWPSISGLTVSPEEQKAFVCRAFLAVIALLTVGRGVRHTRIEPVVAILIIANVLWTAITALVNVPTIRSHQIALFDRIMLFAIPAFAWTLPRERERVRQLLTWVAIGTAALAIYGFFRAYSPQWWGARPSLRMMATFTHPNLFAQMLCVVLPVVAALYWTETNPANRRLFLALLPAILLPFVLTYTRGAILAAGASLAATFLWLLTRNPRRQLVARASLTAAIAVCVILVFWGFDRPSGKRSAVVAEASGERTIESSSLSGRWSLWRQGLDVIRENPAFGAGAGPIRSALALVRGPDDPEKRLRHQDVHQDSLQIAAQFGILAVALYFALVVVLALRARRAASGGDETAIILIAGAMAFFIHGLVDFPLSRCVPRLYAWTLLGWAASLGSGPPAIGRDERPVEPVALAGTAVVAAFLGVWLVGVFAPAAIETIRVERASDALKNGNRVALDRHCQLVMRDDDADPYRRLHCYRWMAPRIGLESLIVTADLAAREPGDYEFAASHALALLRAKRYKAACREVERGIGLWDRHPRWPQITAIALARSGDAAASETCRATAESIPPPVGRNTANLDVETENPGPSSLESDDQPSPEDGG